MSTKERAAIELYYYDWHRPPSHGGARDNQLEPLGDWFIWLMQMGRGSGKTRTAVETIRRRIDSGIWRVVNVAGPTWTDVMDVMVYGQEGAIGLMDVWPPRMRPIPKMGSDNPHLLCWNGAQIRLRAAKEAERFRGPQADGGWVEEIDAWAPNKMSSSAAFSLFELGIRLGKDPRILATSTPKRGKLVAELRKREDCVVTYGSTYDNKRNLAEKFIRVVERKYEGTRFGRQEIYGELLEDVDGAIITSKMIEENRHKGWHRSLYDRIVIGVDPSGSGDQTDVEDDKGLSEKGIVVGARREDHCYLLEDATSREGPDGWGKTVVRKFTEWDADAVVAEKNYGGEMVRHTIQVAAKDLGLVAPPVILVPATRGKHIRAAPAAAPYAQGRIHHVGYFHALENQLTAFTDHGWEGEDTQDRADAWIWVLYDLILGETNDSVVWGGRREKQH
jgi:phage terminase large subunit-like protein